MKAAKIILSLLLVSLFASCSTTFNKNEKSSALGINLVSNLDAEVEVDMTKKIQGTASAKNVFLFFTFSGPSSYADGVMYQPGGADKGFSFFGPGLSEEVKSAAVSNAMVSSKAEIIVAPQYIMKTKSYLLGLYKEITVNVTGYAGTLKSIKSSAK
jgi:hypothetical protein